MVTYWMLRSRARGEILLHLPILHRAILKDVHEFLGWLKTGIGIGGRNDCHPFSMPGDGL